VENPTIVLNNATFTWSGEVQDKRVELSNIGDKEAVSESMHIYFSLKNFSLRPMKVNELIAIVGAVGSGKSSFMSALLNEMPMTEGTCEVLGSLSYCAQTPWLDKNFEIYFF
jgi:ABC-type polysaccharide/polyol phosphate transport system ATPase subunit